MFPANMDVVSWLGAFHVKNEVRLSTNIRRRPLCLVNTHNTMHGSELCWFDMTAAMDGGGGEG